MFNQNKRNFLLQATSVAALTLTGIVNKAFAEWQASLFTHKALDELIGSLIGGATPIESADIHIKAPEIAENGAVVPVTVDTSITEVKNIAIIVDNNPSPLTSSFEINPQLQAYVSTRVKMAESSNIIALVTTNNNEFFKASKSIKVTIGGCGG